MPLPRNNIPAAYASQIRKFRRWNRGAVSFAGLTHYFEQMRGAASTKTVAKYALKRLLKERLLNQNRLGEIAKLDVFFATIKTGRANQRVFFDDIINEQQLQKLRKSCRPKTALLCEILYSTGLRISELAGIKISDCQVQGPVTRIKITGKGKKERRVMIATDIFYRCRLLFTCPSHLVGPKSGGPYTTRYLRQMINECETVLNRRVFPHLFRHSFITNMIAKTGKIKGVSDYVGHSSPAITLAMYCHEVLLPEDLSLTLAVAPESVNV